MNNKDLRMWYPRLDYEEPKVDVTVFGINTLVISGFPGIGKSYLKENNKDKIILDSDSSDFSWEDKGLKIRHKEWPFNYLKHINDNVCKADIILVSSHLEVRQELKNFILVYPDIKIKEEYINRYRTRKSSADFIELLEKNYVNWIAELMEQTNCLHCVLQSGQYLSNLIK